MFITSFAAEAIDIQHTYCGRESNASTWMNATNAAEPERVVFGGAYTEPSSQQGTEQFNISGNGTAGGTAFGEYGDTADTIHTSAAVAS